jgi:MoxR-like ATPase
VLDYALRIVLACHPETVEAASIANRYVRFGPSPRGAQSIITAGKILALLDSRYNVSKADLHKAARSTLRHRLLLNFEAEADGVTADKVVEAVLAHVEAQDKDPVKV